MTKLTMAIKKVDKDIWRNFKAEAAKHEMQLGEFFSRLVKEHVEKESENNWNSILSGKAVINKKQSEELKEGIKDFRKGFDFR